jgi:iron complex outermembrane receptor protein
MVGRGESIATLLASWRLVLALCVALCAIGTAKAESGKVYDVDLPAQSVATALNGLSEQTGVPVVFPYDLARDRKSNPVNGRYTLLDALDVLLRDTGLSGGLSDKGVLTISRSRSRTQQNGETFVTPNENEGSSENGIRTSAPRKRGVAAVLASLAAVFSASAQEVTPSSSSLDEVVVTAQKKSERLQDVPVPVTVLNANDLAINNQVLLRDYYATVPGFNVTPNYVATQNLSIRGITTGGSSTPTVGVTIDDVPFGASAGPHANHVPDIDPGDLARIEILRGPQGTLYGADSMGGLVKFVTIDPSTDAYTGRIEGGTSYVYNGAEPGFNLRASANIPLTDALAVRVSGFTRQDPGYIDNPVLHSNGVNEERADGGRLSALWQASNNISLKLSALFQQIKPEGLDEVDVPTTGHPQTTGLQGLQQNSISGVGSQDTTIQAYSATLKANLGAIELTSLTGYNRVKETDSLDWGFAFGADIQNAFGVNGVPYSEFDDFDKVTQEIRLSGSLWNGVDWLLGGFYTHENDQGGFHVDAQNTATGAIVGQFWNKFQNEPDTFQEYAPFADLTYHFTDRFEVQLGARESYIQRTLQETFQTGVYTSEVLHKPAPVIGPHTDYSANAFTYLATPQFKISPDIMVYARLASGYRPGTPNLPTLGVPRESNADKTKNYEIGAKGDFLDHKLSIDASVYYIDWTDIQITLIDPTTHYVYNTNGSGAKSEGVEFDVTVRPLDGLKVDAWVVYDDAALTQAFPSQSPIYGVPGNRLPLASRFSGNLSAEQDFRITSAMTAFIGGMASYVGDRTGVFTATPLRQDFPSYTKTDLRTGLRYDDWTVNVFANNVADVRGLVNGGIGYFYVPARIYITPRTIGVNVVKTF